jgi:hypothetical protein
VGSLNRVKRADDDMARDSVGGREIEHGGGELRRDMPTIRRRAGPAM